jgi:metallo-beta-lactamase family protein
LEYETNVGADNKELNINNIKNKLIEIQKSILDLNMLLAEGKKKEEDKK